jgi:hypothetical protein
MHRGGFAEHEDHVGLWGAMGEQERTGKAIAVMRDWPLNRPYDPLGKKKPP